MSSLYVRSRVREWCAALSLPFHDTVNTEVSPADPAWLTVQFINAQSSALDFCRSKWERGTFDLIVLTKGNTSDAILAQAEADLAQLMTRQDPGARLCLITAGPFEDFFQPASARWFALSAAVDYQYLHHT